MGSHKGWRKYKDFMYRKNAEKKGKEVSKRTDCQYKITSKQIWGKWSIAKKRFVRYNGGVGNWKQNCERLTVYTLWFKG